jgi:hypothetical protein
MAGRRHCDGHITRRADPDFRCQFDGRDASDDGRRRASGAERKDESPNARIAHNDCQHVLPLWGAGSGAPLIGRVFTPDDHAIGHDGSIVALISEATWRQRFGADANIVGRDRATHADGGRTVFASSVCHRGSPPRGDAAINEFSNERRSGGTHLARASSDMSTSGE